LSFDFSTAVTGGLFFIPELRRLTAVIATNSGVRPARWGAFSLPLEFGKPTSRLRFTQTGLNLIRNPVDLETVHKSMTRLRVSC
jgi:hypothetical protein